MKYSVARRISLIVLFAAFASLGWLAHAAPPPEFTALPPVDLSPGPDVVEPRSFALNRARHKLYVASGVGFMRGVKVIDTTTDAVIAGLDFGWYREPNNRFIAYAMAVDESPAPAGDKLYVVIASSDRTSPFVLRVIDGENESNLTDQGSDIVLPIAPASNPPGIPFPSAVVNPKNHKVYVANNAGEIAVIDGEKRTVLTTLKPDAGSFLAVDPVANKIFVLGRNGGAIIDSATDTVTPPPQPFVFEPRAAAFNEANNRLYIAGVERRSDGLEYGGLYVIDGETGSLVASKTTELGYAASAGMPVAMTIVPAENTVYVGSEEKVYVVDATDLSRRGELLRSAMGIAWDSAKPGVLYTAIKPASNAYLSDNSVWLIDREQGHVVSAVTTAYMPRNLAINPRTDRAYVAHGAAELVVLDANKREVIARVPVAATQSGRREIAVSERLNRVYLSRGNHTPVTGSVDVIDGDTNQVRSSFSIPYDTFDLAVDDIRRRVYVSYARIRVLTPNYSAVTWALQVYDADTEALITSFDVSGPTSGGSAAIGFNRVTGRIYIHTARTEISVFDADTLAPVATVAIPDELSNSDLAVNTTTNKLYVGGTGDVTVVNGAPNSVENVFKTGRDSSVVRNIVADEEADVVYLTDSLPLMSPFDQTSRVAAFDGSNGNAYLGEKAVGGNPVRGWRFAPARGSCFLQIPSTYRRIKTAS